MATRPPSSTSRLSFLARATAELTSPSKNPDHKQHLPPSPWPPRLAVVAQGRCKDPEPQDNSSAAALPLRPSTATIDAQSSPSRDTPNVDGPRSLLILLRQEHTIKHFPVAQSCCCCFLNPNQLVGQCRHSDLTATHLAELGLEPDLV